MLVWCLVTLRPTLVLGRLSLEEFVDGLGLVDSVSRTIPRIQDEQTYLDFLVSLLAEIATPPSHLLPPHTELLRRKDLFDLHLCHVLLAEKQPPGAFVHTVR